MKPYTLNRALAELENFAEKLIYTRFNQSSIIFDRSSLVDLDQ